MTALHRKLEAAATAILKANAERKPAVRVRYRGGYPVLNWLTKQDPQAAATLWQIARRRLPTAANDNAPPAEKGQGVDRRANGRPRGKTPPPRSLEAHLALPSVKARLGDAEPEPAKPRGWFPWFDIKPQRPDMPFHPDCCFGYCAPVIADGAIFTGSIGGLGQPKMGKQRGDIRPAEEPPLPFLPAEIDTVIEITLARGTLEDVGRALGAQGGYAGRRGKQAVLDAANWALAA